MYFKFISYLKFLLRSANEHGVHSPFVFNYVTKCLYSKKKWHNNKSINVLLKSIDYFNYYQIDVKNRIDFKKVLQTQLSNLVFDSNTIDLLYTKDLDPIQFKKIITENRLDNDSMILVDGIYENSKNNELWKEFLQLPEVTVSMDLFHCGVLFIRKEQEKEHFTIRI